jgi:hypothetical protein
MVTGSFGWFCACGAILDQEITGEPDAVEERRRAMTVGWIAHHSGDGHDTSVSRAEAISAWEAKGYDGDRPPATVDGQQRGDAWAKE